MMAALVTWHQAHLAYLPAVFSNSALLLFVTWKLDWALLVFVLGSSTGLYWGLCFKTQQGSTGVHAWKLSWALPGSVLGKQAAIRALRMLPQLQCIARGLPFVLGNSAWFTRGLYACCLDSKLLGEHSRCRLSCSELQQALCCKLCRCRLSCSGLQQALCCMLGMQALGDALSCAACLECRPWGVPSERRPSLTWSVQTF